jgi:hypothetical protein
MTSQLNVDTIVDKAGSGGTNVKIGNTSTYVSDGGAVTQNTVQGIAKQWCNVVGAGTGFNDSFNTSSLEDSGTGIIVITITNTMANDDGSLTATNQYTSSSGTGSFFVNSSTRTASTHRMNHYQNGSLTDPTVYNVTLHGDLA